MQMAWQVFGLGHTTVAGVVGLTRKGFIDMMVRNGLIYPAGQANAYSGLLTRRRGGLEMAAGVGFPIVPIGSESFMPGLDVPMTGHVATQTLYKQREAAWVEEYRRVFGVQDMNLIGGGEQGGGMMMGGGGWQMAMWLENFRHNMTMDALTPGYRVGDRAYYTGGLNW